MHGLRSRVLVGLLLTAPATAQDWVVLRPDSTGSTSDSGASDAARFEIATDGTVHVRATAELVQMRIECPVDLEQVAAVRLEALPDASLPGGGPGLSDSGNFVLSELRLRSAIGRNQRWAELVAASASYAQVGWPVLAAIDARPETGWAVGGRTGERSEAVFVLERPLGRGERTLVFDLEFRFGRRHALGCFRLSATADPQARAEGADAGLGPLAKAVDQSVGRGVAFLLGEQELDGSWAGEQGLYPSGVTALTTYALLKSGLSPEHQAVRRALAYLGAHPPEKTYEAGCHLLAYSAMPESEVWRERARTALESLIDWQVGDWGYPGAHGDPSAGHRDLSNTQYATLGLWAATKLGLEVPPPVWDRLAKAVLAYQKEDGGFTYGPGGGQPTGSMSAAGVTVLAICAQHVRGPAQKELEPAIRRGVAWLDANFTPTNNPGADNAWVAYFLYGVERVGALTGVDVLNSQEWYREGARQFVATQHGDGRWADPWGRPQSTTCYALLFLRRATASSTGPGESSRGPTWGRDDPEVDVSLRASGDTPLTVWVSTFGEALLDGYTFDGEREKGPRVARVEYLTEGGVLLADSRAGGAPWLYTTRSPGDGWTGATFEARGWRDGLSAFGRPDSPQVAVGTEWSDEEIWLRSTVEVQPAELVEPTLELSFSAEAAVGSGGPRGELLKLFDEETNFAELLPQASQGAGLVVEKGGAESGNRSLHVTPRQRANPKVPGWAFPIRENPRQGEYRYVQFAWRKPEGNVMLQLAFDGGWGTAVRYYAGENLIDAKDAIQVGRRSTGRWSVITRDLWKDRGGRDGLLTGMALTPMDDGHAWYDSIYLARERSDLRSIHRLRDEPPEWAVLSEDRAAQTVGGPASTDPEAVTIWLNGEAVFIGDAETEGFEAVLAGEDLIGLLRPGRNTLAVHARNSSAGRALDLGLRDQRRLATIPGNRERPADGNRFATRFSLPRPGTYSIYARVHLVDPVTEHLTTVDSAPLVVQVREALDPEMLDYASDATRNLITGSFEVGASSAMDGWPVASAFDGLQHRGWLSADGDPAPTVRVKLRRPVRADTLLLSHVRVDRANPARTNLPTRVEVLLNGKDSIVSQVHPDRLRKTAIDLGGAQKVRELEVRVLDRSQANDPNLTAVGFAEVELQLRSRR